MPGTAKATNIVPDALIVTYGASDWVWASPCNAGCSPLVNPAAGGTDWSFPTAFPELFQPLLSLPNFFDPNYFITNPLWPSYSLFGTPSSFACASPIFDTVFSHCDYNDAVAGAIDPDGGSANPDNFETWLVRRTAQDVPEPSTLSLISLGLLGLSAMRRRRRDS